MPPSFFKISAHSIIPGDWGDYGDILQQGMAGRTDGVGGCLELLRTGPYIPPITFPGIFEFVLTSEARALLEHSDLTGCSFRPVEKKLVVELRWENWDLDADEPLEYPESGEPEDYIYGKPHSPEAAAALGDLWEVVFSRTARVMKPDKPYTFDIDKEFLIDTSTWDGSDIFGSKDVDYVYFTERAQNWFFGQFGEYVDFEQVLST